MRRVRLTMLLVTPILVATMVAAREAAFPDSAMPNTDAAAQSAQPKWTLAAVADRFVARQQNEPGLGMVPYDAVILRRMLGGVSVDCGAFARPSVTDNAVSRTWTYVVTRPRTGICASVTGARFVAVGRKGSAETLTPAVP